jgi:glycosyltransferase involved in cell wall biosynthesis
LRARGIDDLFGQALSTPRQSRPKEEPPVSLPSLLVFADDWGRHPSSCQHLIGRLLDRYQVFWVNTIGMRPPRLDRATLRRGLEKVRQWLRPPAPAAGAAPAEPSPHVLNPRMWPWFRSALARRFNRFLLARQLASLVRSLDPPPVALTTIPIVADLVGVLPVRHWVYYCVDDFGEWPGLDSRPLRQMEEDLLRRVDRVIAVSDALQAKLAGMGHPAELLTHGVDIDFWRGGAGPLPQLAGLERPLVVFWGAIDRRMDLAFLRQLTEELHQGTVVLVGPEDDPDPALGGLRRLVRLGVLPFASLPNLAAEAGVLIMPYADLPVTRAMQPLKLKEYLATGKPVVVRNLPATLPWADAADLADTPEPFARAVRLRLQAGLPEGQLAARARLAGESWAAKARQFEAWALGPSAAQPPVETGRPCG